ISTIDAILKAYNGREEEMFAALVKKYGPEPPRDDCPPAILNRETQSGNVRDRVVKDSERISVREVIQTILSVAGASYTDVLLALPKESRRALFSSKESTLHVDNSRKNMSDLRSTSNEPEDVRSRLERFMRKYNPEKISTIDAILKAYNGREEEMFAALVKKYGPEPPRDDCPPADTPAPTAVTPVGAHEPEDVRSRLERFMRKYNPGKISTIDAILKAYNGREEEMFAALVKKYGPEPLRDNLPLTTRKDETVSVTVDAEVLRTRLMRFFAKYAPEKLAGVDVLIESCERHSVNELMNSLVSTYGPEPVEESTGVKDDKKEQKKEVLQREEETRGRIDDDERQKLLASLEASGKDAKMVCYSLLTEMELLSFVRTNFGDYEGRIRRLLVRYDPARLEAVPELLRAHCGREDELIAQLTSELGPEPEKTAPTSLLRLMRRRADWRRIDEDTWTDDEESNNDEVLLLRPPKGLTDGRSLIESYQANDPGEFSGDESAAYPHDEEHWYRLFFGGGPVDDGDAVGDDTAAGDAGSFGTQHADGAVLQISPTVDSPSPSPPPSCALRHRRVRGLQVTLGNKFGQAIGALCAPCSVKVARSFEALWQPVGPQYQQLLSETVVKDGYLEKLSSDGRRMGVKWQKRYFRVDDKGMHYYETNAPGEKPKGYKVFTKDSIVIEHIDATVHPKCTDSRYHYFGITVNNSNDMFYLRTPSEDEKRLWVSFMQLAFARVRLTTIGCDQNPSRWRGRMEGLKEAEIGLIDLVHASSVVMQKLRKQHDELKERINAERAHRKLMETQLSEMQEQQAHLAQCVMEAKARAHAVEEDVDVKCLELAESAASVKQQRLEMGNELEETRRSIDGITQTVINMQKEILELESECETREARVRQAYSKWRRCEGREYPENNSIWRSN
ncbi:uncharacterized protein TM35_000401010, partial [Trypanosoma theileri]